MTRLLISTAFAGLLAFGGSALAQGNDDHRQGGGERHEQAAPKAAAPQAARPGPAPGSRPGGSYGRGYVPGAAPAAQNAPAPQPAQPAPTRSAQGNGGGTFLGIPVRPNATPQQGNAPRGGDNGRDQNSRNDQRGNDQRGNDQRGNDRGNDRRGQGFNNDRRDQGQRRDYSAYHRTFNAPRRYRGPTYHRPSGWYARRWNYGEILPSLFWSQSYWLTDYFDFGLDAPPPGTVWVRDGNDALLIDRYSGEIIQVAYDVFY